MIGRSLSFCIRDIANNEVDESDVEMIVSSTRIENNNDLEEVLTSYCDSYWYEKPDKCKEIAKRLYYSGKIFQPRLFDNALSQDMRDMIIWVNNIDECTYYPE